MKYGKHTATIDIYIKNGGRDAFKHEVYGDCIIVERKIMSSGGGSYKIKAKDGKDLFISSNLCLIVCLFLYFL